jgi:hypothetical protein
VTQVYFTANSLIDIDVVLSVKTNIIFTFVWVDHSHVAGILSLIMYANRSQFMALLFLDAHCYAWWTGHFSPHFYYCFLGASQGYQVNLLT